MIKVKFAFFKDTDAPILPFMLYVLEVLLQRLMRLFVRRKANTTYAQLKIALDKQENMLPQIKFLACFCIYVCCVSPYQSEDKLCVIIYVI